MITTTFAANKAIIYDPSCEPVLHIPKNETGLYVIRLYNDEETSETNESLQSLLNVSDEVTLWHQYLAHTSANYQNRLFKDQPQLPDINFNGIKRATCGICSKAKQSKNSYNEKHKRAKFPLEIVLTDMIGPPEPSKNNERYIITFLNDYTHYTTTQVLHYRSEIAKYFKQYERLISTEFNRKIINIRCDGASEFIGNDFRNYCNQNGINLQVSEPFEHEHNATIERYNRSLMEKTRALFYEAKMPNNF